MRIRRTTGSRPKTQIRSIEDDAVFSVVTPGTFATLGNPLKRGRDFQDIDSADAPFTLRPRVHQLSPEVPLKFTTMEASLYEQVAAPRFRTLLLTIFAGLSLCLAIAGVYGVTAYVVGQRSNEIGLRMALGATPGNVLRLILRQGVALAVAGMALGFLGSLAGTRLMTSMLFEVKPTDPVTYAAVGILLGIVVLAASYIPARRAARLDPLIALRQE
ncbi:MAG TPA: FtsX-like permease family protein [Bryobacteraceae bacterium]